MSTVNKTIQVKKGLQADIPVLALAEPGFAHDEERVYFGGNSGNVPLPNKADMNKANVKLFESTGYGVISGLGVTAQATPNMTVQVASGAIHTTDGVELTSTGNSTVAVTASDTIRPRKDITYLKLDGTIGYLEGSYPGVTTGVSVYTITTNAVAGDTLNFYYTGTITAVASGATGSQFNVGADIATTVANIATTLNGISTISAKYTVTSSGSVLTFTEKASGSGNYLYDCAKTGTVVISNTSTMPSCTGPAEPPATPTGCYSLSEIYVAKNVTTITNANITDKRLFKQNNNKITDKLTKVVNQKFRQVTNHCMTYNALSDGTETGVTYRWQYTVLTSFFDLKLVFGNFYTSTAYGTPDTSNTDDITIKASIESSGGTIYPLKFRCSDSVLLKGGAIVESDEFGIEFTKGDTFWVRVNVSVDTLGKKWPIGLYSMSSNTYGEGKTTGDITVSGTPTVNGYTGYHPIAILGKSSVPNSVLLCGDSRFANIYTATGNTYGVTGAYAGLALSTASIPYGVIARSTERVGSFLGVPAKKNRILLAKNFDSVIVNYGINDECFGGESIASVQNYLMKLWTIFANRGLKVYQCTVPPKTTSTDSWATVANQTIDSTSNPIRIAINDWIRTTPQPLSGYFDVADQAESARNSGIWKAGFTSDGLHENNTGIVASSAGIDVSKFI